MYVNLTIRLENSDSSEELPNKLQDIKDFIKNLLAVKEKQNVYVTINIDGIGCSCDYIDDKNQDKEIYCSCYFAEHPYEFCGCCEPYMYGDR